MTCIRKAIAALALVALIGAPAGATSKIHGAGEAPQFNQRVMADARPWCMDECKAPVGTLTGSGVFSPG